MRVGTYHLESGHELHIVHRGEWDEGTNSTRYRRVYQHIPSSSNQRDLCDPTRQLGYEGKSRAYEVTTLPTL